METKISQFIRIRDNRIHLGKKCVFSAENTSSLSAFLKEAYITFDLSYPKFHKMDELSKMGILATDLLLKDKNLPENTALVFSNSSSSLGADKMHQLAIKETVSPSVFVYTLPNIVMGEICIKNQLYGENVFFITEKFNPLLIWEYSESLLRNMEASAIVCGWIEWKNAQYDVFLCLVMREGEHTFSAENLKALYNFENE